MNIITTKAVQQFGLAMGGALVALVAVMFMPGMAHAQFDGWGGDSMDSFGSTDMTGFGSTGTDCCSLGGDTNWGGDTNFGSTDMTGFGSTGTDCCGLGSGSMQTDWNSVGSDSACSFDCSGGSSSLDSGCSSCGGSSGSAYTPPSFGCSSCGGSSYTPPIIYNQPYQQPIYTSPANAAMRQDINTCTATNSCNTTTTYTDNSVYATCTATNSCNTDNSYHYTDNSVFSAPTTVTVTAPTTVTTDSHNQQISYAPPVQQPSYSNNNHNHNNNYQPPVYYNQPYQPAYQPTYQPPVYTPPVTYNRTPYVSLSAVPYTGLDLGPVGEVLYWTFLVLWCLGAAYLIVVKRVQNKLVSALNGFLFGSSATIAHAHSAPAAKAHVAYKAQTADAGVDPFIASQINRA